MANPYYQLLQRRSGKIIDSTDNPKLKLIQDEKKKKQELQLTGNKELDQIIKNDSIKTVKMKQPDGTFKLFSKDEYVNKQKELLSGTLRQSTEAEKPYFTPKSYDQSSGEIKPAEIKYLDTSNDKWYNPKKYIKGAVNAATAAFNVGSEAITSLANKMGDIFNTIDSEGRSLDSYSKTPGFSKYNSDGSQNPEFENQMKYREEFLNKTKGEVGPKQRAAAMWGAANAAAGVYYSQYNALIQSAKKSELPAIKQLGELSDWVFGGVGQLGANLSAKTIDLLPLDQDTKMIFREPFIETGSTLFTLGTLKLAHTASDVKTEGTLGNKLFEKTKIPENIKNKVGTGAAFLGGAIGNPWLPLIPLKEAIQSKIKSRFKNGIPVDSNEAKKIVNEAVKENPIELPVKMEVKTQNEGIVSVDSQQGLVLRNLIKGQEDLNYRKVNNLGVDLNGNPVVARFEWDYKKKEGTILTTKETTAAELAHEFGHYFDRKLTNKVGEKLSDLLPDYKANKAEIDAAFTRYAVEKLMTDVGRATKKAIAETVSKMIDKVPRQVEKLANEGGETRDSFSEKFATAISAVMTNPQKAQKIAPEFTDFALKNLQSFGFLKESMLKTAQKGEKLIADKKAAVEVSDIAGKTLKKEASDFSNRIQAIKEKNSTYSRSPEEKAKSQKGLAMKMSALQRKFEGKATLKEILNSRKFLESNYKGKKVEVDGKSGEITGRVAFGQHEVKFSDGTKRFVVAKNIKGVDKVSSSYILKFLKKQAIDELSGQEKIFGTNKENSIRRIHKDDLAVMSDFTDYVSGSYKPSADEAYKLELDASRIAERYGIGEFKTTSGLSNAFGRILEKSNFKGNVSRENAVRTNEVITETRPTQKIKVEKALKTRGINLEKVNAPDDVLAIVDRVSSSNNEFRKERGAKTTLQEMKDMSLKFYGTEDAYKGLNKDIVENRGKMLAAEQMMVDLAKDAADYLRKIDTGVMTAEQKQTFAQKMLRLQGVQKSFSGARSEAARLFGSLRIEMSPGENSVIGEMMKDMKKLGLDEFNNVGEFFKKKNEALEPTIADKGWHIWYANILSGPSTQVRNFVGNLANGISEVARVAITKPSELPSAISGLYDGLARGTKEAKEIFKSGALSKFEEAKMQPEFKGEYTKYLNYLSYVGRSMSAVDAFFREGFRGMESKGAAFEKAKSEGLKGKELEARTLEIYEKQIEIRDMVVREGMSEAQIRAKYGDEMVDLTKSADTFALRGTYNNDPQGIVGKIAKSIGSFTRIKADDNTFVKIGRGAIRTIVPFTRVVANVVNVGLDWTPLGLTGLSTEKSVLGDIYKQSKQAGKLEINREQHQQLARASIGTAATVILGGLAAGGMMSGTGPSDSKKRSQLMATGWRPNSIKIGDTWIPYSNLGPIGLPAAVVSNYFDAVRYGDVKEDDAQSRLAVALLGSVKTITDMSFLSGVSNLLEAINDPKGYGPSYIRNYVTNIATAPIPAAYGQIRKYFDPTVYETPTIKAAILSDLGITGGLKPRLNVFGEQVNSDYISKLQPIPETKDETLKYLGENNIWITVPSKNTLVGKGKNKRPMTSDEYYTYVKESGVAIKEQLDKNLNKIQSFKDIDKRDKFIDDLIQKEREKVKKKLSIGV